MNARRLGVWPLVAMAVIWPSRSLAEEAQAPDEARALFEEGRDLVKAGKVAEGCEKLERSSNLAPGVGVRFHLADCWEKLGRAASARALFLGAAASAKATGQADREQVLRERAAALDPLLARLVIQVENPAPDLVIKRDAIAIEADSLGSAVALDPGKYRVSASAKGKKEWVQEVEVTASKTTTVEVPELEDEPKAAPAKAKEAAVKPIERTPAKSPPAPVKRGPNVAALISGSLGAGGMIVGGVMALRFLKVNGEAQDICPQNLGCSKQEISDHKKLIDEASTARQVGVAAASMGAVGLLVAGVLYLKRPNEPEQARSALHVDAVASPEGALATLRGSF